MSDSVIASFPKGWLNRQIVAAQKEMESWPDWMRGYTEREIERSIRDGEGSIK